MAGNFKFSAWKVCKLPNKFLELIIYSLRVGWRTLFQAHRNRYSEGMDDAQKFHVVTLILIPTFKIFVLLYSRQKYRQTDRQTDRQTEKLIRCGLGNLISPSRLGNHLVITSDKTWLFSNCCNCVAAAAASAAAAEHSSSTAVAACASRLWMAQPKHCCHIML
jgi:hypothetical protein